MVKYLAISTALLFSVSAWADETNAPAAATPQVKYLAPANDLGISAEGVAKDQDSYQVRVGELHSPGGEAYLLPFRVPTLPPGQHFVNVHFRTQLSGISNETNGLADADLYGLGLRDTPKSQPGDYYQGAHDPKGTLIQAKFLTPAAEVRKNAKDGPFAETTEEGDVALTKYFNKLCGQGDMTGKFIFLRISYDVDPIPPGNNAYNVLTTGADGENESPVISYSIGPVASTP